MNPSILATLERQKQDQNQGQKRMGLFKPVKIDWKQVGKNALWGIVFAMIMVLLVFQEKGQDIIPNLVINWLIYVSLSSGLGLLTNSLNISWIEKPLLRLLAELALSAVYIPLAGVLCLIPPLFIFYDLSPLQAIQYFDWRYLRTLFLISYGFTIVLTGREFLQNWRQAELQAARLREAQATSKFESLKNQVNPHFLFNSFNVLTTLVYKDQDLAAKYIKQLSSNYRYVLESRDTELVPLSRELKALEAYTFLLKIRFGDGFQLNINTPKPDDCAIAPLTLQMLVENAVKHNIVDEAKVLKIDIRQDESGIVVENNLQQKSNESESLGVGLENIKNRYQFLADEAVSIEKTDTHFRVFIPNIEID